jgi:hypothetical protein
MPIRFRASQSETDRRKWCQTINEFLAINVIARGMKSCDPNFFATGWIARGDEWRAST